MSRLSKIATIGHADTAAPNSLVGAAALTSKKLSKVKKKLLKVKALLEKK